MELGTIIVGAISGFAWGGLGFYKNYLASKDKFEPKHLLKSVIIGVVVGGYATYQGIPVESWEQVAVMVGSVPLVQKIIDLILEHVWKVKAKFVKMKKSKK